MVIGMRGGGRDWKQSIPRPWKLQLGASLPATLLGYPRQEPVSAFHPFSEWSMPAEVSLRSIWRFQID